LRTRASPNPRAALALAAAAALAALAGCAAPERPRPLVVLLTDFGAKDDAVGLLRGAVLAVARDAEVLDLTHEVPPYDVEAGARLLEDAPGIFPPGAVFVAVVDPGVGTARRPIAIALANGSTLVGPDNGVLSLAAARYGARSVRAIEDRRFMRGAVSTTFHGRDVFAPAAAHLARGEPRFEEIGPEVGSWVKLAPQRARPLPGGGLEGRVVAIDEPFGNIWTNIEPADLASLGIAPGARLAFAFGEDPRPAATAPLVATFGDVGKGAPLAYWSSRGRLALAIDEGDAARTYGVQRGTRVVVRPTP
jgi:S-adenosylmethionine hydrolase